jgi:hypothetical protein
VAGQEWRRGGTHEKIHGRVGKRVRDVVEERRGEYHITQTTELDDQDAARQRRARWHARGEGSN